MGCNKDKNIIKLGHYTNSQYNNAFLVLASKGVSPTVMENHGAIMGTVVKRKKSRK